ncbi:helix-turn-helix transcriptional regulator [Nocardioides astragali]|uniref:Response regulator transcription factor n=1 Tax=Nocardioides astragali TaxID=1776736 RepID=A0ABW2N4L2_9ACTN|nr:LuxR C-terminal-related transcriptional regulator [Nocardioides astragali]
MSATARHLYAVTAPDGPKTRSCGVRDIDWQLKALRDTIEQRHRPTVPLRSVETRASGQQTPLEALIDWATSAGAAVARIHRADTETSVTAFASVLSTGRAPVISPGSVRLLHALHGRRAAQLRFLEGLLRRHARHRAILIVIDDRTSLDPDADWLVQQLVGLLHDDAVTWVHPARLQPSPEAPIARRAASTRRPSRPPAPRNELTPVGLLPFAPVRPPLTGTAGPAQPPRSTPQHTSPRRDTPHPRHPRRPRFGWLALTDTEVRVVRLVVQGHTNRATAAALFVSVNTISTHLRSIYNKLDVNSRVQLTRVALRHLSEDDQTLTALPQRIDEGAPR